LNFQILHSSGNKRIPINYEQKEVNEKANVHKYVGAESRLSSGAMSPKFLQKISNVAEEKMGWQEKLMAEI
jgi:hypothetical protein